MDDIWMTPRELYDEWTNSYNTLGEKIAITILFVIVWSLTFIFVATLLIFIVYLVFLGIVLLGTIF